MTNKVDIVKDILAPLIRSEKGDLIENFNWTAITKGFVKYEVDSKTLYAEIYKLELTEPEEILSKLPELHDLFITELAEAYVMDKSSITNRELLESPLFKDKANLFTILKNVIAKHERKRIIQELPKMADHLDFSLSENEIKSAIKKKSRTELKSKFKNWDKELKEAPEVTANYLNKEEEADIGVDFESSKEKVKVISLSWIKYAVAAFVVISAGYFYFNSDRFQGSEPIIADLEENTRNVLMISEAGLGYTNTTKNDSISITYVVDKERKEALEKINNSDIQASIENLEWTYIFINDTLKIYGLTKVPEAATCTIIKTSQNKYYLKWEELYFPIIEDKEKRVLSIETDSTIIEQLDKIIFDNE